MTTNVTVTVSGDSLSDAMEALRGLSPDKHKTLDEMPLESFLLYAAERCEREGYEMEVYKKGSKTLSPTEAKREEAKAALKSDLEASLALETAKEDEPKKAKKAKANGKAETDDQRKDRCVRRLQDLYPNHKTDVMKILADFGEGVKSFNAIPADKFEKISEIIAEKFP